MKETDCTADILYQSAPVNLLTGVFVRPGLCENCAAEGRKNMKTKTQKLVILAILSALAFALMMVVKIPVVGFLKYEPKDILLTLAGFLYGPGAAFACTLVTCALELPFSSTGLFGMVMNILSSAAFSCVASWIYSRNKTFKGAVAGCIAGLVCMTVTMLLWNWLISPFYLGVSRAEIGSMLWEMFLPFNLIKAGVNALLVILIYRPFIRVIKLCGLPVGDEEKEQANRS